LKNARVQIKSKESQIVSSQGIDETVLQQRADFLRSDSLVSIVVLSDENDCSIIDGPFPLGVRDATGQVGEWPDSYRVNKEGKLSSGPISTSWVALPTTDRLYPATAACAENPYAPDCQNCSAFANDPAAAQQAGCPLDPTGRYLAALPESKDRPLLRCWNQRQRFGFDMLYPLQRYVDALRSPQIYDTNGAIRSDKTDDPAWQNLYTDASRTDLPASERLVAPLVPNPLFANAVTSAADPSSKAPPRDSRLVLFTSIVGVPWQDLARDQSTFELEQGLRPTTGDSAIDWDTILGDPFATTHPQPVAPRDPLMIEASEPRTALGGTLPNGQSLSRAWNDINGHEWNTSYAGYSGELQYACVFPVADISTTQVTNRCSSFSAEVLTEAKNPLCESYDASDATKAGTGTFTTTQARAGAYPGTRFLHVAKQLGAEGVVGSICAADTSSEAANDPQRVRYGYRATMASLLAAMGPKLAP